MFEEPSRRRNRGFFMAPRHRATIESPPTLAGLYQRSGTLNTAPDYTAQQRSESPVPWDYANSQVQPNLTFTEATPEGIAHHPSLPRDPSGSGISSALERNASTTGLPPTRQPTGSTLGPNRQWSNLGNGSINSWANSESGWAAAVNQAVQRDNDFVDEWQRAMDVHLIFSTLFAAIVTAFLIETYKDLKGEKEEMIALLGEILQQLQSGSSAVVQTLAEASSNNGESHARTRRVNQLWFASLSMTITSAIFAMLAKQWISEYTEGLALDPKRTSKQRLIREARLREFRFAGLRRWYVPEIIGALPILLHVSLLFFGVGLVDFFWVLEKGTAILILVFVVTTYFLYVASVLLPVVFPDSPYRTPLSHLLSNIMRTCTSLVYPSMRKGDPQEKQDPDDEHFEDTKKLRHGFTSNGALLEAERKAVEDQAEDLDKQFLLRLKGTSRSDTIAEWANGELSQLRMHPNHTATGSAQPQPPSQSQSHANGDAAPGSQGRRQGSALGARQQVEAPPPVDPRGGALQLEPGTPTDAGNQV